MISYLGVDAEADGEHEEHAGRCERETAEELARPARERRHGTEEEEHARERCERAGDLFDPERVPRVEMEREQVHVRIVACASDGRRLQGRIAKLSLPPERLGKRTQEVRAIPFHERV
jgi:hypothetical protein